MASNPIAPRPKARACTGGWGDLGSFACTALTLWSDRVEPRRSGASVGGLGGRRGCRAGVRAPGGRRYSPARGRRPRPETSRFAVRLGARGRLGRARTVWGRARESDHEGARMPRAGRGRRRRAHLDERAAPSPPDYPVRSCQATLPRDARRVVLKGRTLPLPARRPRRIAVVGDTGRRLKAVDGFQFCNDPHPWPFAAVARSVARWRPDVVIQVGDYLWGPAVVVVIVLSLDASREAARLALRGRRESGSRSIRELRLHSGETKEVRRLTHLSP
jgi:hypothetical protein